MGEIKEDEKKKETEMQKEQSEINQLGKRESLQRGHNTGTITFSHSFQFINFTLLFFNKNYSLLSVSISHNVYVFS